MHQQSLPWIINKTYDELKAMDDVPKTKTISLITTTKHWKRYNAAMDIKEYFGDQIDMFGDGIHSVKDKWDALAPYKFSIVMENSRTINYFTEKLTDSYLALTYPIYYGCKDNEYFPKESFDELPDIDYTEQMIKKIEQILATPGYYEQALPSLKLAKEMVLDKYNIYPSVIHMIESCPSGFDSGEDSNKKEITLSDKGRFIKDKTMFLKKVWRSLC
jgi:hypothetical protein